jgi:predicted DNA-binding transcriptional regulator AlpA
MFLPHSEHLRTKVCNWILRQDAKKGNAVRSEMMNELKNNGFLRLPQVLALIPVSKSAWWAGVKSGRYPRPIKLGPRTSAWRVSDIMDLLANLSEQKRDMYSYGNINAKRQA